MEDFLGRGFAGSCDRGNERSCLYGNEKPEY